MNRVSRSNNLVLTIRDSTGYYLGRQVLVFRRSINMPESARLSDPAPGTASTWLELAMEYVISTRYKGDRVLHYRVPDQFEALHAKAHVARLREKRLARKKPPLRGLDPASRLLSRRRKETS